MLLVASLVALGLAPLAMPESYDWVEYGTSESGAQGVNGAWVARAGFILFGLAVLWLARIRAPVWKPAGTILHLAFGISMFGVAAYSTRSWEEGASFVASEDLLHSVFATIMGFGFVGGVFAVMVARRLPSTRQALPDLAAIVVTSSIPLTMSSDVWGILQRLMFVTAALWYGREVLLGWRSGNGPPRLSDR